MSLSFKQTFPVFFYSLVKMLWEWFQDFKIFIGDIIYINTSIIHIYMAFGHAIKIAGTFQSIQRTPHTLIIPLKQKQEAVKSNTNLYSCSH